MKYLTLTRRIVLTLLVLLTTTTMWAQIPGLQLSDTVTLTAYAENSYEISSLVDWNNLADYVAVKANPSHNCAGLTFKLTNNIGGTNDSLRKPLGRQIGKDKKNDRMRFAGTIEGNGKTLTVAINSEDGSVQYQYSKVECAPIAFAQDATVRDLTVIGTIKTKGQFASGLVGQSGPDNVPSQGTCVIENCHVSVTFVGNTTGNNTYGNHGTFIAIAEGNASITNSWFDGKITGANYYYSGGFIGLNKATATLENCLFNPSEISVTNMRGSSEFVHDNNGGHSLTDCYYTMSFSDPEDAQGIRVFTTKPSGTLGTDYEEVTTADTDTSHHYYVVLHNIDWNDIINAIEDLEEGETATMTLQNDVLAGILDEAIVIPANKTLDLSLNNHILDRGLDVTSAKADGCVFKVYGALIISGGTVKGGNNTGNGGAIYNDEGTLTATNVTFTSNYAAQGGAIYVAGGTVYVNGGTISSNKATTSTGASGSGIYLNAGELTLNGCTISSNKSNSAVYNNGVGVYVAGGTFNITGKTTIKDNKCTKSSNAQRNVYLVDNEIINITGSITNSTVRVAMQTPGVITNGLGSNKVNVFTPDMTGYVVQKVNNEAKLVQQITRPIASYSGTSDKWVFISSPVLADFNPTNVNGLLTAEYDLYRFNQSAAKEWENYKNTEHQSGFVLENGKGYLYATNGSNVILKFAGDMNTASSQDVDLDYDANARLAGYNLVGNPFPVEAYVNRPYYKMNADGTNVEATATSTTTPIPVITGVIVQATATGEKVTFSTTAPSKTFNDNGSIQMSLVKSGRRGESEMQDNAIVSFNEGEQLGKFIFNENAAKLYIPQNGKDFAIVSAERKGEMPVNFEAKEMGWYTINISGDDMNDVYLVDKIEGAVIDLSVNTSYTFIGSDADRSDRFKLVFNATSNDFENANFAYQSGNDIIVNGEGELQVFDVTGRVVNNAVVNGVEAIALPQGVYVFRMNGNVQKIVVR